MSEGRQAESESRWVTAAADGNSRADARRTTRWRLDEQQVKATRMAVVLALFLVLLAAALLAGGHAVIDPMLRTAAEDREAKRVGDIVYTMPDGTFCRHLAFDNASGELTEGPIEKCAHKPIRARPRTIGFSWSAH